MHELIRGTNSSRLSLRRFAGPFRTTLWYAVTKVPSALIEGLRNDLRNRRIGSGMSRLDEYWVRNGRLDPNHEDAAGLLCYISQWVDAGWRDIDVIQDGLSAFPKGRRVRLSIMDYAYVLMAEGVVWVAEENIERALANFNLVLSLRAEIPDKVMLALAHFWSSRCNRKAGEYDHALDHVAEACRLALEAGAGPMAATMRVAESWLLFQKSRTKDALKLLGEAEAILRETDDYITRGNIQSSYGRMYRREGRYDLGLRHFFQAIEEYGKRDPEHRNLARTLANMGYVERLIALQLQQTDRLPTPPSESAPNPICAVTTRTCGPRHWLIWTAPPRSTICMPTIAVPARSA